MDEYRHDHDPKNVAGSWPANGLGHSWRKRHENQIYKSEGRFPRNRNDVLGKVTETFSVILYLLGMALLKLIYLFPAKTNVGTF